MLNVDEYNLLSDRKFRNRFEHYDDLIDDWFSNRSGAVYSDLAMNPSLRGPMATNDHRGYNSFNNTLIIRRESLDLDKVLNALEEIRHSCSHYVLT